MQALTRLAVVMLTASLAGCGISLWPFGRSSSDESARVPEGATEYVCAESKRVYVRPMNEGKAVWLFLPERELRLERSNDERYSSGSTTLSLQGDIANVEVDGNKVYADCKRTTADRSAPIPST